MKRITKICALAMFWLGSSALFANQSPIPMLQKTANQIIEVLKQHRSQLAHNPSIVYNAVDQYMVPHVDVDGMSRSVLGRQAWIKATSNEREEFKQVFKQLVIRTYASPLAGYTNETVEFLPIRGSLDGQFVRVSSVIVRPNANNIGLNYSLVYQSGQWKIYDLSVEGVSLLQSFHNQFAEVLQNSDMQTLIKEMRQRSSLKAQKS